MYSHTCTLCFLLLPAAQWEHENYAVLRRKKKSLVCSLLHWLITKTIIILLLLLLFCLFVLSINPIDFFWCLLLFLLLHFHPLSFISTSPLTVTSLLSIVSSLSSPAMHLGIPQDMESDPDDEVNRFFIITWNCFFFVQLSVCFCFVCRRCDNYVCCRYFAPVQYLNLWDAAD